MRKALLIIGVLLIAFTIVAIPVGIAVISAAVATVTTVTATTMAMGQIAFSSIAMTQEALLHGNSEQRLAVLEPLVKTLREQAPETLTPELVEWIQPGLEACAEDENPEVVSLATDLIAFLDASVAAKLDEGGGSNSVHLKSDDAERPNDAPSNLESASGEVTNERRSDQAKTANESRD